MSHIVTIKTEVRDVAAIQAACQRLTLPPPVNGTFELFSSTAKGLAVKLPNWQYPVVCDVASGQVAKQGATQAAQHATDPMNGKDATDGRR